ncbi:MAG: hypothetical protein U0Q03_07845 [Acidimicrobiales bacterium]
MTVLWMVLAAALGAVAGYLFRGRTPAQHARRRHRAATPPPSRSDELARLTAEVDRLATQLAITRTERDRLRHLATADDEPDREPDEERVEEPDEEPAGDEEAVAGADVE